MVLQAASARFVRLLAAVCVTALSVLIVGAASARAAESSLTLSYTCALPMIGSQAISVTYDEDLPGSVTQGVPASRVRATAHIAASAVATEGLALAGASTVSGSAVGDESVADGAARFGESVRYTVPRAAVPGSGAFTMDATGTLPSVTFPDAGKATLRVGNLKLTLTPRDSKGRPTALGTFTAACTLRPGQNNVLGTIPVRAKTAAAIATTTTIASSANPSVQGQTVTYTATVSPAGGGSVAFNDGGTPVTGCGAQSLTSGQATCQVSYTTTGSHAITAVYSGDKSHAGSTSAALTQRVVVDRADLMVRLSMPAHASNGAVITQTVTVFNSGPAAASTQVTALQEPPELAIIDADGALVRGPLLTWSRPSMPPGATRTFRVTVQVTSRAHGTVQVIAAALSVTPDPDMFNNAAFGSIRLN